MTLERKVLHENKKMVIKRFLLFVLEQNRRHSSGITTSSSLGWTVVRPLICVNVQPFRLLKLPADDVTSRPLRSSVDKGTHRYCIYRVILTRYEMDTFVKYSTDGQSVPFFM